MLSPPPEIPSQNVLRISPVFNLPPDPFGWVRERFWSILMVVSVLGLMLFAAGGEGACARLDTCLEDE